LSTPIDSLLFRRACARFATGVTVATVCGPDGLPHGLTVNSFTSVSLAPPLVLVCIDYASTVLDLFRASQCYGVNVLDESQQGISNKFARRGHDQFNGIAWEPGATGAPLITGALARFECAVRQTVEAGDHAVFIAEVVRVEYREGRPLLYFGSGYGRME